MGHKLRVRPATPLPTSASGQLAKSATLQAGFSWLWQYTLSFDTFQSLGFNWYGAVGLHTAGLSPYSSPEVLSRQGGQCCHEHVALAPTWKSLRRVFYSTTTRAACASYSATLHTSVAVWPVGDTLAAHHGTYWPLATRVRAVLPALRGNSGTTTLQRSLQASSLQIRLWKSSGRLRTTTLKRARHRSPGLSACGSQMPC